MNSKAGVTSIPGREEVEQKLASLEGCTPVAWVRVVEGHSGPVAAEFVAQREKPEWNKAGQWMPLSYAAPQLAQLIEWVRELSADHWRCFHCGEVFTTPESAQEHFGKSLNCETACAIDAAEYRAMEDRMQRYNEEDSDLHREISRLQSKHVQELRAEEEKGYAKGLKDYTALEAERDRLSADHARLKEDYGWTCGMLRDACAERDRLSAQLSAQSAEVERLAKYEELIYAVGNKYPGETRHQTALRYIQQAEAAHNNAFAATSPAVSDEQGEVK